MTGRMPEKRIQIIYIIVLPAIRQPEYFRTLREIVYN